MKKILFALFIILGFSHCTKFGKTISVEGRVINPLTGAGIEGAEVRINRNTTNTYEGGGKTVKSTTTDANGYFSMDRLGVIERHELQANAVPYGYDLGWYSESGELLSKSGNLFLKKGKTTRANYHVVPFGKLKTNIVNQNCGGANDTLIINRYSSLTEFEWGKFNPALYLGCYSNFGNFNDAPMGWYKMYGVVKRNGVITSVSDSVYLQAGGEAILNIYY